MKYKTSLVLLDKKNERGEFESETISALDILTLDNNVRIAFGYRTKKRLPFAYLAVMRGKATIIDNNISKSVGEAIGTLIDYFGSLEATGLSIEQKYKELNLI